MAINIFEIKPNKVPVKPEDYSTLIYGPPKIGKTTLAYDMFGDSILFIATEDRHKALAGGMVQRVTNWSEYLQVLNQLRQPKAKEQFKAVAIDTVENLYDMLEKYIAAQYKEKSVGERNDIWGSDWIDLKKDWKNGLQMITNFGYVPVFICHAVQEVSQIPASGVLDSEIEGNVERKTVKDKNTGKESEVLEFLKYRPDLKDKVLSPINKMVDNILFINTTVDIATGKEQRVIYLRDTLQWLAGSTFQNIKPIIPLSADAYREAINEAVNKIDKDLTKEDADKNTQTVYDYNELMAEVKKYGQLFYKANKMPLVTQISDEVFGLGNKVTDATESQTELLSVALEKMKEKAEKEGIIGG